MAETTKIQWTDYTWSPWRGCAKVSRGCQHCYAEKLSHRNPEVLGEWGPNGRRAINKDWQQLHRWNRKAEQDGIRRKVFPSLCDPFEDRRDLDSWRTLFFDFIRDTPHLDYLILTKRPENWRRCWPLDPIPGHVRQNEGDGKDWRKIPNLWMGVSAEDQETADARIPILLEIPAAVRWVSYEPALGPIDFTRVGPSRTDEKGTLEWVIVGGESGPNARPFHLAWARSTIRQCHEAGVACFMKQLGGNPLVIPRPGDPKGGEPSEWPEDIRVREFPRTSPLTPRCQP